MQPVQILVRMFQQLKYPSLRLNIRYLTHIHPKLASVWLYLVSSFWKCYGRYRLAWTKKSISYHDERVLNSSTGSDA